MEAADIECPPDDSRLEMYDGDDAFGESDQMLRRRIGRADAPAQRLAPVSEQSQGFRARFVVNSEAQERAEREERCRSWAFTGIFMCVVLGLVLFHRAALSLMPEPVKVVPTLAQTSQDRFDYLNLSSWRDFEMRGTQCVRPSDSEASVWARVGEACENGACLNITTLLRTLESAAARDGEAYSTMGATRRGAPTPCAYALKDGATVRSYLVPRIVRESARLDRYELEIRWGRVINVTVATKTRVEHLAWPGGEKSIERADGIDAAQWAVAMFILGDGDAD